MDSPPQKEFGPRPDLSRDDFKSLYKEGPNIALLLGWVFSILALIPCALMLLFAGMGPSRAGFGIYVFVFAIPSILSALALAYDFNRKKPDKMPLKWIIPAVITGIELLFIFAL